MRVAINALAVEPRRPGGDVTYVRELVRWLPRVAPDVEWVVFTSRTGRALLPADAPTVRCVVCPVRGESLVVRALWEQCLLPRLVQRARVDVLHAPVNVAPMAAGVPVVLTLHESEPFMPRSRIPLPLAAWWRVVRAGSAHRADRLLTVSNAARDDLVRWMRLPPERLHVVYLGVDRQRFSPAASTEHAPLDRRPYVLWMGRPYPGKNLGRLIAACATLRRRGRSEVLALVGPPGWAEGEIQRAVERHGLHDGVVRLPAQWDGLAAWYRNCAVFAYPSIRESFGLPVLEGMACGVPVVAGDIPALREVGGPAAAYADPLQTDALAQALWQVLTDADHAARLRRAGPARAAQFDWTATARATLAHYREAAGLAA